TGAAGRGVGAGGDRGAGGGQGLRGRQLAVGDRQAARVVRGQDPATVAGDAHRDHLVTVPVERREHVPGAQARYRVLRAPPAEHDRHPDLALLVQCRPPLGGDRRRGQTPYRSASAPPAASSMTASATPIRPWVTPATTSVIGIST